MGELVTGQPNEESTDVPTLGLDLSDLSTFDNSWERLIESALPSDNAQALVKFISTGSLSPAFRYPAELWEHNGLHIAARPLLAVVLANTGAQRVRTIETARTVTDPHDPVEWWRFATVGRQRLEHQASFADLVQVGAHLGFTSHGLAVGLLDPARVWWAGTGSHRPMVDSLSFIEEHAEAIRAGLAKAKPNHDLAWSYLASIDEGLLELFAPELFKASTSRNKPLRSYASALLWNLSLATRQSFDLPTDDLDVAPLTLPVINVPRVEAHQLDPLGTADRNIAEWLASIMNGEDPAVFPERHGLGPPNAADRLFHANSFQDVLHIGHVVRLLVASSRFDSHWQSFSFARSLPVPTPEEVTALAGPERSRDAASLVAVLLGTNPDQWHDRDLTPWIVHHVHDLCELLRHTPDFTTKARRRGLFLLIERSAIVPARLEAELLDAVFHGFKSDQDAIDRIIDHHYAEAVAERLRSKNASERQKAADWITRHPLASTVADDLHDAVASEGNTVARAAMLRALVAIGESVAEHFSRAELVENSHKKPIKQNAAARWLANVDFTQLTWTDDTSVDPAIAEYLVLDAIRLKTARPSPETHHYITQMHQAGVAQLCSSLLREWIAEDVRPRTEAQARAKAAEEISWSFRSGTSMRFPGLTKQQAEDQLTAEFRTGFAGSASTSRGVLSIVGLAAGASEAHAALAYIRKHKGRRKAQSKALIELLGQIDDPAAAQALMALSTRFKPASLQREAAHQVELVAERKGWSLDELADRMVPDGGFDSNGRQSVEYGSRTFTLALNDDLTVGVVNDETGKTVRSLPQARAADDDDLVKQAKAMLSSVRKEMKHAANLQPTRLHAAMCVQRSWTPDEFRALFLTNPVIARLAGRIVWVEVTNDTVRTFRPLSDGTLTDTDDDAISFNPGTRISIAHDQNVPAGIGQHWIEHLDDYEIAPLFAQFDRSMPTFDVGATLINEFNGMVMDQGTLRAAALREGWELGPGLDGPVTNTVVRRFPTLNLEAALQFDGVVSLTFQDIGADACTLQTLSFHPLGSDEELPGLSLSAIPLSNIPSILLSEIYTEAQSISISGVASPDDTKVGP